MPYRGSNYDFVIDSSFRPFTFQEMLAPLAVYKDAYDRAEEAAIALGKEANAYEYLSRSLPENSRARQMYEGYANELKTQASDLARNGLTINNRTALFNLKKSGVMDQIKRADEARRAQIEEQHKLYLQDPTRMFSRYAATSTIDDYLDNPDIKYQSYSGTLLAQQVGTAASAIAKSISDFGEGKPLDNYTKTWLKQHGYTADQVAKAIQNPGSTEADRVLGTIVQNVVNDSGIPQWADADTLNRAYGWAREGLWNAVGQSSVDSYEDFGSREALKHRYHELEANNAATRAAQLAAQQQAAANKIKITPMNIFSSKEKEQAAEDMEEFAKYFTTDANGKTTMTKAGLDEYNRKIKNEQTITSPTGATMRVRVDGERDSAFKTFIDSIGGEKYAKAKQVGNLGNLWNIHQKNNPEASYDATKSTEFDFPIDDSQQKGIKGAIQTAARGTELREVDFDRKTNTFKPTGKTLSMEDLNSDKYIIGSTRFSFYNSGEGHYGTVMIKDDKGNVKRYRMPAGIDPINEANRDRNMRWAKFLMDNRQGGRIRIPDDIARERGLQIGTVIEVTPAQIQAEYERALQEAYLHHSQLGVQNKVKEQEFNPYAY